MTIGRIQVSRTLALSAGLLLANGVRAQGNEGAMGTDSAQGTQTQKTQADTGQSNMGQDTSANGSQAGNPQNQSGGQGTKDDSNTPGQDATQGAVGQGTTLGQDVAHGAMGPSTQGQGTTQGAPDQGRVNSQQATPTMAGTAQERSVSGKVTSIDDKALTVNDDEQVRLTDQTEFLRGDKSTTRADIKPGERVRAAYHARGKLAYATRVWVRSAAVDQQNGDQSGAQK